MTENIFDVARRADLFFKEKSPIHETMHRLGNALNGMNIPFAIAGAMAANAHGHKRTTADVDILIREQDLKRFKDRWLGLAIKSLRSREIHRAMEGGPDRRGLLSDTNLPRS